MVSTYTKNVVNEKSVKNNAGGVAFQIEGLKQLERFLILGSVGGTFYVNEHDLTKENLQVIEQALEEHGAKAVDLIREVGVSNRAPKHDPALLALALAVSSTNDEARARAYSVFNDVVRTGTHLFHFLAYMKNRRGWGRALRRTVANWYLQKDAKSLAYQLMKYKQRDGWSHRDVIYLAHVKAETEEQNALFKYVRQGTLFAGDSDAHRFVEACERASASDNVDEVVALIREFNLPREVLPTEFLNHAKVWDALAPQMGMTALLRNLRNMHKDGFLVQGSEAVTTVRQRLTDAEALRRARIHPAHVFMAMKNAQDVPDPIKRALEDSFYMSFGNVKPTNKRILLALDVSYSMESGGWNSKNLATPREWSALQAMVTARVEPEAEFRAFSDRLVRINITANDSLDSVITKMRNIDFGGTDCSLPMYTARMANEKFDAFCVYTDNETWAGGYRYGRSGEASSGNVMQELRQYRQKSGIHDAKLAVVGITRTGFSIADPSDFNTLDVVGFDANAPAVMADFIRGS